jgi:hypothetical protein
MARITDIRSTNAFGVGADIQAALTVLEQSNNTKIRLIGAMGPPNWDPAGARQDAGSVWCINSSKAEVADVLRYNPLPEALEGAVSTCFPFPAQP